MKYFTCYYLKIMLSMFGICLISNLVEAQTLVELRSSPSRQNNLEVKKGMGLMQALKRVEEQFDVVFLYQTEVTKNKTIHHSRSVSNNLKKALEEILADQGLQFKQMGTKTYGIYPKQVERKPDRLIRAQEQVSGTVTDASSGETLPGVNIQVRGTTTGTSTDPNGNYELTVASLRDTLIFSFVGYQSQAVPIAGRTTVDVALKTQVISEKEMVVVGYGTQERSDVTGSISTVNGEDLQNVQTDNVAEALQGQSAGALVTQSSGEPGSGMDIMIRGASTLGSTDPLYVVDGVPIEGDLSSLNVADIESVEILKDASATAIYGSRAANGVVMITTNSGSVGATQIQVSAKAGISNIPVSRRLDMMNTRQFHEFSVDAYQNAGLPIPAAWQEPNLSKNLQQNTDWQDKLFRQGLTQNYNLTVSGGNDNAIYSFTGGYLDEKGTVVGNGFERLSGRINSEYYIGKNKRLTIGEHLSVSRRKETGAISNDTFKETFQQSPTVPLRCPENLGGFCGPTNETSPGFRLNQVALLHLEKNKNIPKRLLGNAYAEYDIVPNLEYRLSLSADLSEGTGESFTPLYDLKSNVNSQRILNQTRSENRAIIVENTLTYNLTFNDVHEFTGLAGYTQEKREYEFITGEARGFPSGNLRTINAATGQTIVSGGATASALRSFLGRIQYNYNDRYRAQFAIRRDGSSRFGSERRWGTFPSGSLSWSINNESFMNQYEDLSQLTLRGSWGVTGSQQIPDFAAIPVVQPVANYVLGISPHKVSGSAILNVGNSKLQWQETKQLDIGLDIGFFNQGLTFVLDYFKKNTSNVLLRPPVVTSSGFRRGNGAFQNVGKVQNRGFEFSAHYQKSVGNFSFQVGGNISTIHNEVKSLGAESSIIITQGDEIGQGQTITKPGSEVGAFYGYISDGIFRDQAAVNNHAEQPGAAPGDLKFRDLNDDGVITPADRTIIGSPFPDFYYGLNLNLNYKNLGLKVQMDGVQGRDIMDLRSDNDPKGFNNATTDYLDRWTPNNRDGTYPRAHTTDPNNNFRSSSFRVEEGSYLAIRNITLSYNVDPSTFNEWVDFRNLRLYISSSNLAWFTPYDGYNPEMGAGVGQQASLTRSLDQGTYPIARTFEFGIDIGF